MLKTEQINIKKFNKEIDNHSFLSKNLYNLANYYVRQEFINNRKWLRFYDIYNLVKLNDNYKQLPSQTAQQILRLLDKNWISFFKSIKDWKHNKNKYNGMPRLPKYKNKNGRNVLIYPFQNLRIKDNYINIPKTNFKFKLRNKINNIKEVRIIPQNSNYKLEVVYEIKEKQLNNEIKKVLSIDLGLNNFSTCYNNVGLVPFIINGKIVKSINQFYNKKLSFLKSEAKLKNNKESTKQIQRLTQKRNQKVKDFLHKSSKYLVNFCLNNNIDTVIVGYNKQWKQSVNIGRKNNQKFVQISYLTFVNQLDYKLKEQGIKLIKQEESYTSKIDSLIKEKIIKKENYLGKRIRRGLFKSSTNKLINADVNGSINIMRKFVGNEIVYPIEDLVFNSVKINIF